MFQLKRILFPVDFSERSRASAGYAEALCGRFDAELILLHVIEPARYDSTVEDLREVRAEELDAFLGSDLRHFRVERIIEHGEAAKKIVECAASRHADLIIMPTQGLGIYRRLILGSSTAKVLHDADCPVWTGVHQENAPRLDDVSFRRVLCAVDLKAPSAAVLDWARRFAAEYQAELLLAHITPAFEAAPARFLDREFQAEIHHQAEHLLEELQKVVGSKAAIRVEGGDPPKQLTAIANEWNADVMIIGRRAEAGILGRLEASAYSIIRQSPCPVVSV